MAHADQTLRQASLHRLTSDDAGWLRRDIGSCNNGAMTLFLRLASPLRVIGFVTSQRSRIALHLHSNCACATRPSRPTATRATRINKSVKNAD